MGMKLSAKWKLELSLITDMRWEGNGKEVMGMVANGNRNTVPAHLIVIGVNVTGTLGVAGRAPKNVVIRRLFCSTVELNTVHWAHCR